MIMLSQWVEDVTGGPDWATDRLFCWGSSKIIYIDWVSPGRSRMGF